jgi:hypothetical protein
MRHAVIAAVLTFEALAVAAAASRAGPANGIEVHAQAGDTGAVEIERMTRVGKAEVERYFGHAFPEPVRLTVAPNRASFDAALPAAWDMGKSQCWMVGVGVADFLLVLSPQAWAKEACEHDPTDEAKTRRVVVHELTHVFHGQHNPTRDFSGADEIGWFVEGLAVVVSGQLDAEHRGDAAEAIARGAAPASLATAWSGRYRYGVSGSLVRYIEARYGRAMLFDLLPAKRQSDILGRLGVTEAELIQSWEAWVQAGSPARA